MNAPVPISRTFGNGSHLAVVMSPVMPEWDEGAFFAPLTDHLVGCDYRVRIFDTLSLLDEDSCSLATYAHRWSSHLQALGPISLLAGNALGGSLAQALLGMPLARQVDNVLLISAPTRADALLEQRLGEMARLARAGKMTEALHLLAYRVQPAGTAAPSLPARIECGADPRRMRRLSEGFDMLRGLDLAQILDRFDKPVLSIHGQQSQLVRQVNVRLTANPAHRQLEIAGAGMRPLPEHLQEIVAAMADTLHIEPQVQP